MFYSDIDQSIIQQCNAALSSFYLRFYLTAISVFLNRNQFCKKLAEVIVILNRASSNDKHTKKSQNTCPSLLLKELFLRNSSNNASSLAINPSLTFFCFNLGALDSGIVMLKNGLDRASIVGKLGYWTSRASEIRRQRRVLGGTLSTSPAQFTASMFVNKTKTTLRAHTVDKNTSSVCRSKRRFRPKPHAPVLFLSIYRDTVPLTFINVALTFIKVKSCPLEVTCTSCDYLCMHAVVEWILVKILP